MISTGSSSQEIEDLRETAESLWWQGVQAVKGQQAVKTWLASNEPDVPDLTVAIGKAASSMCLAAVEHFAGQGRYRIVTKYDHVDEALRDQPAVAVHECGHPIPDRNSLIAGEAVLTDIRQLPEGARLLMLVSGGASSLFEVLKSGWNLDDLETLNRELMASGESIEAINARRRALSQVKDGRLLEAFEGSRIDVLGISDVPQSDFATLGSGIGDIGRVRTGSMRTARAAMIGSNRHARDAVARAASERGLPVIENSESLYVDVNVAAESCAQRLIDGDAGVYIWGGEPTVVLPEHPGEGGRNQALGLLIARLIDRRDALAVIVAGTDGTDGPTEAAGALVDGSSYRKSPGAEAADACLEAADSGRFLKETGDRFVSGPTGTNVMDLVIAIKAP